MVIVASVKRRAAMMRVISHNQPIATTDVIMQIVTITTQMEQNSRKVLQSSSNHH